MIPSLKKRFIIYTMLVISTILCIFAVAVLLGTKDNITHHRTFILVFIILIFVFIGSVILSNIAIKPIKKAWQQQLDFTADASHELRTPIAIIRSNLEIVMDNQGESVKDQEKWLNNIFKETERMSKLVDDLLTLSKADSKEQELNLREIPLDIIIRDRINSFETLAKNNNTTISNQVEDGLTMLGDDKRIAQLFTILIDNAIKYMNRPGIIAISGKKKGNHVHISVSDNGVGIPEDEVDKLFLRFYRVEKSRARNLGGSGLGLPIAKWIVESHKGKISINSTQDIGTNVTIIF